MLALFRISIDLSDGADGDGRVEREGAEVLGEGEGEGVAGAGGEGDV
jgi:hypothetical protein